MIKRIMMIALAVVSLGAAGMIAFSTPELAYADAKADVCAGLPGGCAANSDNKINSTLKSVVGILSSIVGAVAVIMLIISGFRYVTSGGDSNKIASAKNTLIYAIVGIVVVALAQFIVQFVLDRAT
jgi:hypothetical protein